MTSGQAISKLKHDKKYSNEVIEPLEKEHKVVRILKEKRVNVGNFIYWFKSHNTYEEYTQGCYQEQWYLHYKDNNDNRCKFWKLTQAEFDLLKEVLL